MIHVTKTSVERVAYTRAEVIERLVESEDFDFRADDEPQNPEQSRAAWGELSDTELAYHLALRLNEDLSDVTELTETVTADIGDKGSDNAQWTVDGWTGDEPGSTLRAVLNAQKEAQ